LYLGGGTPTAALAHSAKLCISPSNTIKLSSLCRCPPKAAAHSPRASAPSPLAPCAPPRELALRSFASVHAMPSKLTRSSDRLPKAALKYSAPQSYYRGLLHPSANSQCQTMDWLVQCHQATQTMARRRPHYNTPRRNRINAAFQTQTQGHIAKTLLHHTIRHCQTGRPPRQPPKPKATRPRHMPQQGNQEPTQNDPAGRPVICTASRPQPNIPLLRLAPLCLLTHHAKTLHPTETNVPQTRQGAPQQTPVALCPLFTLA
jgi:hypothetical protein